MAFKVYGLFICAIYNLFIFDIVIFIDFFLEFHHFLLFCFHFSTFHFSTSITHWLWVMEAMKTTDSGTLFILKEGENYIICESMMNLRHYDKWSDLFLLNCSCSHRYFQGALGNLSWSSKRPMACCIPSPHFYVLGQVSFHRRSSVFISRNVKWVVMWAIPRKTGRR